MTFRSVDAQDGTFSVEIPVPWRVEAAQVDMFSARSTQGQSVAWGVISAIDDAHFRLMQSYLGPFASEVFPVVSPPRPPAGVIEELLPRLNRAVQGLRVTGARPVAGESMGSFVAYQYTLVPSLAPPGQRSRIAPSLLALSQVPMKAEALILTNPPNADGIWTIVYWGAEAPQSLFAPTRPVFERIFASLRYNQALILNMIAQQERARGNIIGGMIRDEAAHNARTSAMISQFGRNMQQIESQLNNAFQTEKRRSGEDWIAAFGGPQKFVDAQGREYNFDLEQHSYRYNCVSGWGAAARYYGSNTLDCTQLGAIYGTLDMKPIHQKLR